MLDSKVVKELAEKHVALRLMIENVDKGNIRLDIAGAFGQDYVCISNANDTEAKVLQTIANSLKELAVTYERQIQNIVRKELRE